MTGRLVVVLVGVTAVVLMALVIPLAVSFESQRSTELTVSLERDALRLGGLAEDHLEGTEQRDVQALVDSYQRQTGGRVVIVDGSGIAIADSDPPTGVAPSVGRTFASRPEIAAALDGETSNLERRSETLDDTVFVVAAPVRSGDRIIGAVRVSRSTHELAEEVLRYRLTLGSIAAFALALAAALGFLTGRWATRPIRRLQHAAAALGRDDFRTQADTEHGPPEVRDLARRFNSMADRVDRLIQTSQQFAADASHQLRTPLTAIRLRLDTLSDEPGSADPNVVHALVDDVDRLQRTIDGLLALTRIDQSKVRPETLDLATLVVERCDMWRPLADEAGVELLPDVDDGCEGHFDRDHLDQVLDNLIDNALAHAPEGSAVEFRAEAAAERVELHVTDHGPGIADDRRNRALERHWHERTDGTGIGLAVCARLCEHNGATLRLDETTGGGLDAVISMGRPPPSQSAPRTT